MPNLNRCVKHKKYTIKFKKEVVRYAKEHSVKETFHTFVGYRKIFAYILKFVFWSLLQVLFKLNPLVVDVSRLLKK